MCCGKQNEFQTVSAKTVSTSPSLPYKKEHVKAVITTVTPTLSGSCQRAFNSAHRLIISIHSSTAITRAPVPY